MTPTTAPARSLSRRSLLGGSLAALAVPALAACGAGTGAGAQPSTAGGSIRFTWWGPDFYVKFTNEMIELYKKAHAGVTVSPEPSVWGSYWDRLATQVAAKDEPDVINMDGKYLAEYAGRGVLADLEKTAGLDLSGVAAADLDAGRIDGKLYALSTGSNAFVVLANPEVFAKAGVDLPDDRTWTWQQYHDLATKIAQQAKGTFGTSGGGSYADLTIFLRQNGEDLFGDADGLGYTDATLAKWYDVHLQLQESGATLSASAQVEEGSASYEQQAFPTKRAAMMWSWTNQLGNARTATGNEKVVMLRPPSLSGSAGQNGLFLKASMYWSIAARSKNLATAASLVNFLVNDTAAAQVQLLNRGVPSNTKIIEAMKPKFTATDTYVAEKLAEFAKDITAKPPAVQPIGASDSQNVIARYLTEVRFKRLTPADAAAKTSDEIRKMIKSA